MTRTEKFKAYREQLINESVEIESRLKEYDVLKADCEYEKAKAEMYETACRNYENYLRTKI